jgi:CheY-like chemotaxis protein
MPPHRHSVLIVDDDADILDAFSITLTLADVVTHAVSSGREALDILDRGLRPCAIFLDVRMPGLDGWQVRELILDGGEALASTPVVLVSAEPPDAVRRQKAGIAAWLQKPVGVLDLAAALNRVCPIAQLDEHMLTAGRPRLQRRSSGESGA